MGAEQLKMFEPSVIRKAALISDSPRRAFYNLRLEMFMGNYFVLKESGCLNKVLDKRLWQFDSSEKAEKVFDRLLKDKTDPERRSPRKYRVKGVCKA